MEDRPLITLDEVKETLTVWYGIQVEKALEEGADFVILWGDDLEFLQLILNDLRFMEGTLLLPHFPLHIDRELDRVEGRQFDLKDSGAFLSEESLKDKPFPEYIKAPREAGRPKYILLQSPIIYNKKNKEYVNSFRRLCIQGTGIKMVGLAHLPLEDKGGMGRVVKMLSSLGKDEDNKPVKFNRIAIVKVTFSTKNVFGSRVVNKLLFGSRVELILHLLHLRTSQRKINAELFFPTVYV